jgi:hypothetical protein
MAVSVFGNRRPLRAILPATSTQQVAKEVRTEDELRQALQPLDTSATASLVGNTGRRIIITAPITLKAPITIDVSLPGTVIESNGYLPIICGTDGIDAFVVQAVRCTLSGLFFMSATAGGAATVGEFLTCVRVETTGDFCRILDCHTFDCDSFAVVETGANDGIIRGCIVGKTVATADCVTIDGARWRVMGNILDAGTGGGLAVVVTANGGRCAIVGNDCGSDGITTSASLGNNTISANTRAGAVTAHASDDTLGGNT